VILLTKRLAIFERERLFIDYRFSIRIKLISKYGLFIFNVMNILSLHSFNQKFIKNYINNINITNSGIKDVSNKKI
jgi:hypothetical protein